MTRVIISTGQGRLHLIESAVALQAAGCDVRLITGFIPSRCFPTHCLDLIGRLCAKHRISSGLRKRMPPQLQRSQIKTCGWSEVSMHLHLLLSRIRLFNADKATVGGWESFGRASCRFIEGCEIFHFRAGAGRGGALETAKRCGAKTLCDFSIAHPEVIAENLRDACRRFSRNIPIDPNSHFWKSVMRDAEEADGVLVNSEYVAETLIRKGTRPERIHIARLGLPNHFSGVKENWEIQGGPVLLFTGAFDIRKGAHTILSALEILDEQQMPCKLVVCGLPHSSFSDYARRLKLSKVEFVGFVPRERLLGYYRDSDMYVFPSLAEGAAQSASEAMIAGLPVIVTKESGVPIIDGINGLMVKRDDPVELASAIRRMCSDHSLRIRLAKRAVDDLTSLCNWRKYAESTVAAYRTLIASA